MRFTILYVEAIPTIGMVTARVLYVPSGSFWYHRSSERIVRRDLQFIVLIRED